MSELLLLTDRHPIVCVIALFFGFQLARWPFILANRFIRHRNIKAAGWPPAHLDADGDYKQ